MSDFEQLAKNLGEETLAILKSQAELTWNDISQSEKDNLKDATKLVFKYRLQLAANPNDATTRQKYELLLSALNDYQVVSSIKFKAALDQAVEKTAETLGKFLGAALDKAI